MNKKHLNFLIMVLILTLLILTLLLTSCTSNSRPDNESKTPEASITLPEDSSIMCMANNHVYYDTEEVIDGKINITLFRKNIYDDNIEKIEEFKDVAGYPVESLFLNGNIYFLLQNNNNQDVIYEINATTGLIEPIYSIKDDTSFIFLKSMKNSIAILKILRKESESIHYEIDVLDLKTYKSKKIVEKSAKEASGTVISHMYTRDEDIYTLEGDRNGDDVMNIVNYDQNGNVIKEYKVDLTDFLDLSDLELGLQKDFALDLYVYDKYYIISTANQRKAIYKLEENELREIKIPEILYKSDSESYQVLVPSTGVINTCLYFYNRTNGKLIKFDAKNGTFESIILPKQYSSSFYMYLNNENQLFVLQQANTDNSEFQYTLLNTENLEYNLLDVN